MPSPPIQVFLTTIASQPALRQRQELLLRVLHVKKIPFKSYDLASDEDAKKLWRRKALPNQQQLPGILVGGKVPGTFAEFEDAVEHDELAIFLRLNDAYDPSVEEDRPLLEQKVIGVPGATNASPLKFKGIPSPAPTPSKSGASGSPANLKVPSPTPVHRRNEFDVGEELVGYGLQGLKVTHDELAALVEELGLDGEEAEDLVKGLGEPKLAAPDFSSASNKSDKPATKDDKPAAKAGKPVATADKPAATAEKPRVKVEEAPTETALESNQPTTEPKKATVEPEKMNSDTTKVPPDAEKAAPDAEKAAPDVEKATNAEQAATETSKQL